MKTRRNLMVLVLLSLFLSVGVADSNVTDVNATGITEEILSAFAEADKLVEEEKRSKERLLAKQEEKRLDEKLKRLREKERIINLAIAGS